MDQPPHDAAPAAEPARGLPLPTVPVPTVLLGSGEFAVPILDALASASDIDLRAVVSTPPRPAGRERRPRPTPVAERAASMGLPLQVPGRLRDPAALEAIAALSPELLVLADYGRIVPAPLLELPRHGALNLHPSLLPRHRGAAPIPATILAGDAETGVTLMRMDEGVDTGPIIAVRRVALRGDETAPLLEARLAAEAARLLLETLPGWIAGTRPARPQPAVGATLTRPLRREDGRLDPASSAKRLERQVRALLPWPGSWVDSPGGRLIVWAARPVPVSSTPGGAAAAGRAVSAVALAGSLVALGPDVALVAADGPLVLEEVQPAGGRRMSGREYRRGRRDLPEA